MPHLTPIFRTLALCLAALGLVLPAAGSPPVTNGLALWVDASQLTGLTNEQQVETWTDMSGQTNDAIRQSGSSAGYPMYVANVLNGQPVVRFNTPNKDPGDYFRFNRISTIRTVFWVIKENSGAVFSHMLLGDQATYHFSRGNTNEIWHPTWASPNILNGTTRLMGTVTNGVTASLPAEQFQVISVITLGDVEANQICQDRSSFSAHGSWQGDIAEILIYTNALDATQEEQVGSYLADKYGLATAYPDIRPRAFILTFGLPDSPADINHATLAVDWPVPYGSVLTNLAPEFTVSAGATCNKTSGSPYNFTSPVTYTVISSDNAITNNYTVTVTVLPPLAFVDITNIVGTITEMNTTQYIAGTNSEYVVGGMTWTNSAGGGGTLDTAPGGWSFTVDLSPGNNVISVGGTNYAGDLASDTVTVFHSSAGVQLPVTNGLALWVDAAQIISLTNSQQVETWPDMSGAGNNAIRQSGSSAGYPMYVTDVINGRPVVRFNRDGSAPCIGDYFRFNRISTIRTVFWVVKENAGLSGSHFLLGDSSTWDFSREENVGNGAIWSSTWAHNNIQNGTTKLMGVVTNGTTTAIPANQFQVISLVTIGNVQANQITQDRSAHGSWVGDIAEIIIYTTALTDDEEMQVGSYLAAKYALPTAYPAMAYVDITNIVGITNVPSDTTSIDIIGTNNEFTVDMWWNNSGGGAGTLNPVPGQWNFTATLVPGANIITVSGSNAAGIVHSDSVTVNVIPEPAVAGAIVICYSLLVRAKRRSAN